MSDANVPDPDAERQSDGTYLKVLPDGSRMRWSRRPDGTWRKPERTRAGFTGELEQKKYVPAAVAAQPRDPDYDRSVPGMPRGGKIPGLAPDDSAQPSNANAKAEAKKKKKQEEKEAKERDMIVANANGTSAAAQPAAKKTDAPQQEATNGGYPSAPEQVDTEKKRKNLLKKLRQIEELEDRQKKGETLSDDQHSKLQSRSQVEAEIVDLDNGGPAAKAPAPRPVATPAQAAPAPATKPAAAPSPVAQAAAAEPPAESAADPAKRKKAITKKLQQIEALEDKVKKGEDLDAEQQAKLDSKAALKKELATL